MFLLLDTCVHNMTGDSAISFGAHAGSARHIGT